MTPQCFISFIVKWCVLVSKKKDVMQYTVQLVSAAFTLSGHKPEQYGSLLLSACELSVEKESYRWMSEICLGET